MRLAVNIDHIATLRQVRGTRYPEPLQAALVAEQAGADAITLHLREDRRHIQDRDVEALRHMLQTRMNLEMAATPEMAAIARRIRPADCCLVPEHREELTTEGGLDVASRESELTDYCGALGEAGIRVSAPPWSRSTPAVMPKPATPAPAQSNWTASIRPWPWAPAWGYRSTPAMAWITTMSGLSPLSPASGNSISATPSSPAPSLPAWTRPCGT